MKNHSRVIFSDCSYTACAMSYGALVVTTNRKQSGKQLIGETAANWISDIENAIDKEEARALCRAIINA